MDDRWKTADTHARRRRRVCTPCEKRRDDTNKIIFIYTQHTYREKPTLLRWDMPPFQEEKAAGL
jgi:hypothetical protein